MTQQLLNERQQKAQALARELADMEGVWIASALPLDDQQKLRLQILDREENYVVQRLRDWGFQPIFVSVLPRIGLVEVIPACTFEIDLPRAVQAPPDRTIYGEIASPKKTDYEREQLRKYLGLGPPPERGREREK